MSQIRVSSEEHSDFFPKFLDHLCRSACLINGGRQLGTVARQSAVGVSGFIGSLSLCDLIFHMFFFFFKFLQVLQLLKDIISDEKLYDDRNASIVLADEALEHALDVKALHLTEIRWGEVLQTLISRVNTFL